MTRRLTRLADFAYRRRGRVVVAWIAAMIVTIGLGSSFAGEYNADYDTPGSESKAASDLTERNSRATRVRRSTSSGPTRTGRPARLHSSASIPFLLRRGRSSTSGRKRPPVSPMTARLRRPRCR